MNSLLSDIQNAITTNLTNSELAEAISIALGDKKLKGKINTAIKSFLKSEVSDQASEDDLEDKKMTVKELLKKKKLSTVGKKEDFILPYDIIFSIGKFLPPQDYLMFSEVSKSIRKALRCGRLEGESKIVVEYFNKQISILKEMMNDVLEDFDNIEKYPNAPERVQLTAVQENGNAIKYIKNPSKEVQLAAVKQNGCAIQYIKNPSEEVKLEAVKQIKIMRRSKK